MFTTAGPSLSTSTEKSGNARVGAATGTVGGFALATCTGGAVTACEVENGNQSGRVHPATASASVAASTLSRLTSNFIVAPFPLVLLRTKFESSLRQGMFVKKFNGCDGVM